MKTPDTDETKRLVQYSFTDLTSLMFMKKYSTLCTQEITPRSQQRQTESSIDFATETQMTGPDGCVYRLTETLPEV